MNRPANARFVAVSTLLFALHKGSLSVQEISFPILNNVKVRINSVV